MPAPAAAGLDRQGDLVRQPRLRPRAGRGPPRFRAAACPSPTASVAGRATTHVARPLQTSPAIPSFRRTPPRRTPQACRQAHLWHRAERCGSFAVRPPTPPVCPAATRVLRPERAPVAGQRHAQSRRRGGFTGPSPRQRRYSAGSCQPSGGDDQPSAGGGSKTRDTDASTLVASPLRADDPRTAPGRCQRRPTSARPARRLVWSEQSPHA